MQLLLTTHNGLCVLRLYVEGARGRAPVASRGAGEFEIPRVFATFVSQK